MGGDTADKISFLLNDRLVELGGFAATDTLLDYLRLEERLRGTKEGCAEGDCGACTVLIGRMNVAGDLKYETVTACIRLLGSLHGTHVVTVEHLRGKDGALHPVQQALVETHGSQCGFCTPGFVMSLYALWLENPKPDRAAIEKSLQGNLCRCTGYAPIVEAGIKLAQSKSAEDRLQLERKQIINRLKSIESGKRIVIGGDRPEAIVPKDAADLAEVLDAHTDATIVAGATDVGLWVTKMGRDIAPALFINHLTELQEIEDTDEKLTIGAGVSYTDAFPLVVKAFPQMQELWDRIGGEQVRNMGTVGGNLANGSPIGDTPPPFIALGATLNLRSQSGVRELPLEDFFIEYGKQDRATNEFVQSVSLPKPGADDRFAVYKVSKRKDEDITAVCGAFCLAVDGGNTIRNARIVYGGMAGTPMRARTVEAALEGKPWSRETIDAAKKGFKEDYQPLSDWRASAQYRQRVAENLLERFFLEYESAEAPVRLAG